MRISDWSSDVCSSDLQFEHRTARVAERVSASAAEVERVQGGLEDFAASAEAHVQNLGEAQQRLNLLELLSDQMLDKIAHSGTETPDTPYIRLALAGMEEVRATVEAGIAGGAVSPQQLFDTNYTPLAGDTPQQYMNGLARSE